MTLFDSLILTHVCFRLPHEPSPIPSDSNPPNKKMRKRNQNKTKNTLFPSTENSCSEIESKGLAENSLPVIQPSAEFTENKTATKIKKTQLSYFRKVMADKEKLEKLELLMNRFTTQRWGDAYALFRGKNLRAFVRSEKVILGRSTSSFTPDIDLSKEAYAKGISRSQIELKATNIHDGKFSIKNLGKATVFVNGNAVLSGKTKVLPHLSFLEVCPCSDIEFCLFLPGWTC